MRTLRFHEYGEPSDILCLDEAAVPSPNPGHIRVRVHACGLNPADWALCRGLFAGDLPRGIGLDVSGIVDAVGEGVTTIGVGDRAVGSASFWNYSSAGASDYAVLERWAQAPDGLDLTEAAALPMAVETASIHLDALGPSAGQTILIHAAGTMMGFAAVQMALMRGARVIATAGCTFAGQLRALGASVTSYGDGMVERVREIAGGAPDVILDTAWPNGGLPDLIKIGGGDPWRVLTMTDFASAAELGARHSFGETMARREGVLDEFAKLAADGRFIVPIARTYRLDDWREALAASLSGHAHGKLMLLPAAA
ncbi:MAG TPA: NADP-dependent oxidoreductase [Caulobacteraceae bacterium]|jgi:NADPH:quinone reductase-like Zn-dependent oxidoreductase|nr:NADP-dependent oxidoreductase [Caulobacteraceae bacterium]